MKTVLPGRLAAVASFVREGAYLADIGTDHAYLPIFLAERGRISYAVASDIRPGPLSRAEENIRMAGLSERIQTIQTDGLSGLERYPLTDIVIAGMGGCLIIDILHGYTGGAKLILGAQKDACRLRTFLSETGYRISEDFTVEDRGKFYDVIGAERGRCRPDEMQKKFGVFYKRPNPALLARCRFDLARLAGTPNDVKDIEEVIKWQLR